MLHGPLANQNIWPKSEACLHSAVLLCSVMLVALAVGAIKEKATVMLG